jgi:hypothetical protein
VADLELELVKMHKMVADRAADPLTQRLPQAHLDRVIMEVQVLIIFLEQAAAVQVQSVEMQQVILHPATAVQDPLLTHLGD